MKPHILVIEDDEHTSRVIGIALRKLGYEVTLARKPTEAMEAICDGTKYAVISIDGNLGKSKYDTMPFIKKAAELGSAPIILAASSDPQVRVQMVSDGCTNAMPQNTKNCIPIWIKEHVPIPE